MFGGSTISNKFLNFCKITKKNDYRPGCHEHSPPRLPKTSQFSLWELPGLHFGRVWAPLGRILAVLGRLSVALGRSWAPLKQLLGVPWTPLGVSWVSLGPLGRLLGDVQSILNGFSEGLGEVRAPRWTPTVPSECPCRPSQPILLLWVIQAADFVSSLPLCSKWPRRGARSVYNLAKIGSIVEG